MVPTYEQPPDMSDEQRELLRMAVQRGYFRVPREISMTALSAMHGESATKTSQQLRESIDAHLRHHLLGE